MKIKWRNCKTKAQKRAYHAEWMRENYNSKPKGKQRDGRQVAARRLARETMTGHYWDVLPVERRVRIILKRALCR